MDKKTAIIAFGSMAEIGRAVGVSRQAVFYWPDKLPKRVEEKIREAADRLGVSLDHPTCPTCGKKYKPPRMKNG